MSKSAVEHRVENEWHYPPLISRGFHPLERHAEGQVRGYTYEAPNGVTVTCRTGTHCDHWSSSTGAGGLWKELEKWLRENF